MVTVGNIICSFDRVILYFTRSTYYRNNIWDFSALTSVEQHIHQLIVEHHFLFVYCKIHALLNREMPTGIKKSSRIMGKYGWNRVAIKNINMLEKYTKPLIILFKKLGYKPTNGKTNNRYYLLFLWQINVILL